MKMSLSSSLMLQVNTAWKLPMSVVPQRLVPKSRFLSRFPSPLPNYSLNCEGGNTVLIDPLTDNDWTVTWEDGTVGNTYTATFNPHHDNWLTATFEDPLGCSSFEDSTFVWMGYPVELGTR